VLVLETIRSYPNLRDNVFGPKLIAALGTCGVTGEIYPIAPVTDLAAIDDEGDSASLQAQADKVTDFRADAVLRIVEARSRSQLIGGSLRGADYALALHDVASRKTVWKATVHLAVPGGLIQTWDDPTSKLVDTIIGRLGEDNIVAGCAAPAKR
jgi:hypothetical protein